MASGGCISAGTREWKGLTVDPWICGSVMSSLEFDKAPEPCVSSLPLRLCSLKLLFFSFLTI